MAWPPAPMSPAWAGASSAVVSSCACKNSEKEEEGQMTDIGLRVRIPGNARISSASECLLTRQQDDYEGLQYRAEMAVSQIVGVLTWEFLCSGSSSKRRIPSLETTKSDPGFGFFGWAAWPLAGLGEVSEVSSLAASGFHSEQSKSAVAGAKSSNKTCRAFRIQVIRMLRILTAWRLRLRLLDTKATPDSFRGL